jgi:hypothetical protein
MAKTHSCIRNRSNTACEPADLRQRRARRPQCDSANQSLSRIEPVSGTPKWKLENGEQRLAPETHRPWTESVEIAGQRLGRTSLTRRNVGGSHAPGNHTAETGLPGWDERTRTPESVRNKIHLNWRHSFRGFGRTAQQRLFALSCGVAEYAAAARISAGVAGAEGRTASRRGCSVCLAGRIRTPEYAKKIIRSDIRHFALDCPPCASL